MLAVIRQYFLAKPFEANNDRTASSEPDPFALAALPGVDALRSCARTRNRLQARDSQQQSTLVRCIGPEPKFVLAGRSRRAHNIAASLLLQGAAHDIAAERQTE